MISVLQAVYRGDNFSQFRESVLSTSVHLKMIDKYVIVVDGEVDQATASFLKDLEKQKKYEVIYFKENQGLANALNKGLSFINSEWFVRMDSDDKSLENRIPFTLKQIAKKDCEVLGFGMNVVCDKLDEKKYRAARTSYFSKLFGFIFSSPTYHPTVACKTQFIKSIGGYPDIYRREDSALWLKVYHKRGRVINIDQPVIDFYQCLSSLQKRRGIEYAKSEILLLSYKLKAFPFLFPIIVFTTPILFLFRLSPKQIHTLLYKLFSK